MFKVFIFITLFSLKFSMAQVLQVDSATQYETKKYLSYTLAKELNESVEALKDRTWFKDKKAFTALKYANDAYWAKLNIHNLATSAQTYYLQAENQFTYKIEYYLVENKKIIKHIEDGVTSKNHNRPFNANHMLFPLTVQANSQVVVYFKIRNYNKINIDFKLVTNDYLVDYYQTYNMLEGIFFGGMILMIFYNIFLYFLFRIRAYIYYVAYAFWLSVYFVGLFGFSERYFNSYPYFFYCSSGAIFIFLTLFVQSILQLKTKLPKVHKFLNLYLVYFLLNTIITACILELELFFYAQLLFNVFFIFLCIFALTIIGSTYYLAYFKEDSIAKFYAIIWSLLALIGLLLPLQYLNILQVSIPANYIFQFLTLVEILFFSFILAQNINLLEREKKEREQLFLQQNKLASMGEVVSMIAHQWRQPLSEINGVILSMDMDYQKKQLSSTKFNHYLDSIENTTNYMSETINDFINYFKHNKQTEEFQVSDLIKGALNLVSSTNKAHINIQYLQEHPKLSINSYHSELLQALLIVINNAIDACSQKETSSMCLILIRVEKTKKHTLISVEDNGHGIPSDIIDKIYDPYFTTKHKSKGTGLGLYILKMIIEEHISGKIEISSDEFITKCNLYIPNSVNK